MIELQRVNLKEISKLEPALTGGHRLCAGCGAGTMARQVTLAAQALEAPFMIINATGCLEVATTIYPYNSWTVPWLHNAFENASATASGTHHFKKAGAITTKSCPALICRLTLSNFNSEWPYR